VNWFWHALWIAFVIIPVAMLWFSACFEVIIRPDMGTAARIGWLLFILVLPLFGALVYLVATPRLHAAAPVGRSGGAATGNVSSNSVAGDLDRIATLHRDGLLTADEFASAKARLIAPVAVA
jgi:hypothetical protein